MNDVQIRAVIRHMLRDWNELPEAQREALTRVVNDRCDCPTYYRGSYATPGERCIVHNKTARKAYLASS